jgi:opacity protein-like surface antigen
LLKFHLKKRKNKMKKFFVSVVALLAATSAFAADPVFGPAKPPVKEGTGTFKAQSYGLEVKSVNDVKFVGIYDNKNGNGAVQKKLQSFSFQGVEFFTTATLSTNANVDKAYAGASAMVQFGPVVPGISIAAGVTVRGVELERGFNIKNSYYPTVALTVDPMTLVRNTMSTPARAEKTVRQFVKDLF